MEEKKISRREAMRKMGLYAGSMLISPSLFVFCSKLKGEDPTDPTTDPETLPEPLVLGGAPEFFIKRVTDAINNSYKFPAESNNLNGKYTIYTIINKQSPTVKGSIELSGNIQGEVVNLLIKIIRKGTWGHNHYVEIEQECEDTPLYNPTKWRYSSRLAPGPNQQPLYGAPLEGTGIVQGSTVAIEDGSVSREFPLGSAPMTLNWNLLCAVPHLSQRTPPEPFVVVDQYDMYAGERKLTPWKDTVVEINGISHKLYCWVMTGRGTLPTFYWLNSKGQLLFVNTGMEVYIKS